MTTLTGPDIPAIQCYTPDGCCGPSPCGISEDDFICQIRSLLPEGELYNNTMPTTPPETELGAIGAAGVGCSRVGCEQLVFGSCCERSVIPCDTAKVAPQVALVDSFAAVAFTAMQALCSVIRELDPCTADLTLRRWGQRYGLVTDDLCAPQWSDDVLRALLCELQRTRQSVINWDYLTALAGRFGAHITISAAGDFNCGPSGWWTMARSLTGCDPRETCPEGVEPNAWAGPWLRLVPTCQGEPDSLNLVLSPADIVPPPNCNLPVVTRSHDPALYAALKWLLPHILPRNILWCIYDQDVPNCLI